jgi:hypothetical protein
MRWNWQLPDWPDFRFDAERIRASEEQFLKCSGVVIGALHHLDTDARDGLTIELISQENICQCLRQNALANRTYKTHDNIVTAGYKAWNDLIDLTDTIKSIASRAWFQCVNS